MSLRPFACLAVVVSLAAAAPASAQIRTYVIPANDGYGLSECLAEGGPCGQEIAEAWCAANGMSKAVSFGRAGTAEVTGSIGAAGVSEGAEAVVVSCDD